MVVFVHVRKKMKRKRIEMREKCHRDWKMRSKYCEKKCAAHKRELRSSLRLEYTIRVFKRHTWQGGEDNRTEQKKEHYSHIYAMVVHIYAGNRENRTETKSMLHT